MGCCQAPLPRSQCSQNRNPKKDKSYHLETAVTNESKMADDELEKLRSQRMAELRSQLQGGGEREDEGREKDEAMRRERDMKNSILSQILDQDARARLNSIALVKPDKARMVESMLIQMAQTGQLQGKLGEAQLVNLLERVNEQTKKTTTVKFDRRRHTLSSDEDDD